MKTMKGGTRIGVFASAVALFILPVQLCLLPDASLTAAERDCCKQMAGQCDQSRGNTFHSCCQRTVDPRLFNLEPKAKSSQLNPLAAAHVALFPPPGLFLSIPGEFTALDWAADSHGPPRSAFLFSTILRI